VPAQYNFDWVVKDDYSYNYYGQNENRNGDNTEGSYFVQLPDGRLQTVKYYVNGDSGFVAEVSYSGEPKYEASSYKPAYAPAPYKQPAYAPAPAYKADPYNPAPSYKSATYKPAPKAYQPAYQPAYPQPAAYKPVYKPAYKPAQKYNH
jgi:hypothetical protein